MKLAVSIIKAILLIPLTLCLFAMCLFFPPLILLFLLGLTVKECRKTQRAKTFWRTKWKDETNTRKEMLLRPSMAFEAPDLLLRPTQEQETQSRELLRSKE